MKKTGWRGVWLRGLAFAVLWVAYGLAAILPREDNHTAVAVGGLVLGAVFLWATGALLLAFAGPRRFGWPALLVVFAGLLAADWGAKAMVAAALPTAAPDGTIFTLVPGWLAICYAPNYSNNVVLNLLGVTTGTPLLHALAKAAAMVLAAGLLWWYCRQQRYSLADGRFRLAVALLAAGGVSSVVESAMRGFILDFIAFAGMVAFDIKDLCLMYGVGLLVVTLLDWETAAARAKKQAAGGQVDDTTGHK